MYMEVNKGDAYITFENLPMDHVPAFWALSAKMGGLSKPILGHVQVAPVRDRPKDIWVEEVWSDDVKREGGITTLVHVDTMAPRKGIRGFAARNYFGREYVEQFGRELLLSTPGVTVEEEAEGTIRLDLHDKPWECTAEELAEIAVGVRAHLLPSGALSTFEYTPLSKPEDICVKWNFGPNFRLITPYERTHGVPPGRKK